MQQRRRFPIGIADFKGLRHRQCYYVDKTALIYRLIDKGKFYFLSRPCRFGKSLLVSTMRYLFEGERSLFEGLAIHRQWNWSQSHPVVRLRFSGGKYSHPENTENRILKQLKRIAKKTGIESSEKTSITAADELERVIIGLYEATGKQVVVLIDEYDKPILEVISNTDGAIANRNCLREVYGILKDCEEYTRFVFFTGISMFSKVNLFSGVNNLDDITLNPVYSSICGYTEQELNIVFAPELQGLDDKEIRYWYNGYNWLGKEVYNPYSILQLLKRRELQGWWHKTSIPKYLYDITKERQITPIEIGTQYVDDEVISSFDVDNMNIDSLLFQSGYLTIVRKKTENSITKYKLSSPNFEIRQLLNKTLFDHMSSLKLDMYASGGKLINALVHHEFKEFKKGLHALLAKAPHPWYDSASFGKHEAWYASVLYWSMLAYGANVIVEDVSHRGRCDMVVCYKDHVFVMEFKMAKSKNSHEALEGDLTQTKERGYADAYRDQGEHIYLMALVFDQEERNITEIATEYF